MPEFESMPEFDLVPAGRDAFHVGQLMRDALVAVDAGPLSGEQELLMDARRPGALFGDVHRLHAVTVPAFERIVGFQPRPFMFGKRPAHPDELVARVDRTEDLAP